VEYRLGGGVHWRQWQDGIAVFVASTCETHVLNLDLLPVFLDNRFTSNQTCQSIQSTTTRLEDHKLILDENLNLLASLKIIELVD
jgi:hypothetical protein